MKRRMKMKRKGKKEKIYDISNLFKEMTWEDLFTKLEMQFGIYDLKKIKLKEIF
jgi:hypothetical protein